MDLELVIKIPKEKLSIIKNKMYCGIYDSDLYKAIANGTSLPERLQDTLDKIRAEIDVARFIDKDTKLCKNANASGLEVAMQIIDKYKAERTEE